MPATPRAGQPRRRAHRRGRQAARVLPAPRSPPLPPPSRRRPLTARVPWRAPPPPPPPAPCRCRCCLAVEPDGVRAPRAESGGAPVGPPRRDGHANAHPAQAMGACRRMPGGTAGGGSGRRRRYQTIVARAAASRARPSATPCRHRHAATAAHSRRPTAVTLSPLRGGSDATAATPQVPGGDHNWGTDLDEKGGDRGKGWTNVTMEWSREGWVSGNEGAEGGQWVSPWHQKHAWVGAPSSNTQHKPESRHRNCPTPPHPTSPPPAPLTAPSAPLG